MNVKDFANSLLEMQWELEHLRAENYRLQQIVEDYRDSQVAELDHHCQVFGSILTAALDPNSHINKNFGK